MLGILLRKLSYVFLLSSFLTMTFAMNTYGQETLPFVEDFEGTAADGETLIEEDLTEWTNYTPTGNVGWYSREHDDEKFAEMTSHESGEANEAWLITPSLDLENFEAVSLSFGLVVAWWTHDGLEVLISENFDGENPGDADWTDVTEHFDIPSEPDQGFGDQVSLSHIFTEYSGEVHFAFKYSGDDNADETTTYQIYYVSAQEEVPRITNVEEAPVVVDVTDSGPWGVSVETTDIVDNVAFYTRLNQGDWTSTDMVMNEDRWEAEIGNDLGLGDVVDYYFVASDEFDRTHEVPGEITSTWYDTIPYYSLGVTEAESRVLALPFEEGPGGVPTDTSKYANVINVFGNPEYVEDSPTGQYSLKFDRHNGDFLESLSPLLNSEEFSLSFWWKGTDIHDGGVTMVAKEGAADLGFYARPNYRVFYAWSGGWLDAITHVDGDNKRIRHDFRDWGGANAEDQWYRAVYEFSADTSHFQIRDENNVLIFAKGMNPEGPAALARGPFRIAMSTDRDDGELSELFFDGLIDNVELYNYYGAIDPPASIAISRNEYQLAPLTVYEDEASESQKVGVGVNNNDILESATLNYSINGGDWLPTDLEYDEEENLWLADLPGNRDVGDVIHYYFEVSDYATFDYDGTTVIQPGDETGRGWHDYIPYFSYGVTEKESQLLALDFEEGEGDPVDKSQYNIPFEVGGSPEYVEDSHTGTYSMRFNSENEDFLRTLSPMLATDELSLSFWWKVDEFGENHAPFMIKEAHGFFTYSGDWRNTPNYHAYLWNGNQLHIRPSTDGNANPTIRTTLGEGFENEWFRVVLEYSSEQDTLVVQLRDENNIVLFQEAHNKHTLADAWDTDVEDIDFQLTPQQGYFHIARAFNNSGSDGVVFNYDYFDGYIDDVQIHNYFGAVEPAQHAITGATQLSRLEQIGDAPYTVTMSAFDVTDPTLHYRDSRQAEEFSTESMSRVTMTTWDADIPAQDLGAVVDYYVSGRDPSGTLVTYPENAVEEDNYLRFGVTDANEPLVLHMNFADGAAADASVYNHSGDGIAHTLQAFGNPQFDDEEYISEGYSLYLDGESFLEIDNPVLANEEFTISFNFRAEDLLSGEFVSLIIYEGQPTWFRPNFRVLLNTSDIIEAQTWPFEGGGGERLNIPTGFEPSLDTWYRAVYEYEYIGDDTYRATIQVRDMDGNVLGEASEEDHRPAGGYEGPFRIGSDTSMLEFNEDGEIESILSFQGHIDDIEIYSTSLNLTGAEDEIVADLPQEFSLDQNYPNPFNPSTNITYALQHDVNVTLRVYDLLGREVAVLVDKQQEAGQYEVQFDASNMSSGVYLYRLQAGDFTETRKMMFVK